MQVSIIVPVYNTARYLDKCIGSVVEQDGSINYELLLIDDGSVDGSGAICDRYAEEYSNIKVLHQENRGAAASRNRGIEIAEGEYILFLDSDDFYNRSDMIMTLYHEASRMQADIVCFEYCRVDERNKKLRIYDQEWESHRINETKEISIVELIRRGLYTSSSCTKMIRKKLLIEKHIQFEKGSRCEDIEFSMKLLVCAETIGYLPDCFYCYLVRSGSTTTSVNPETITDMMKSIASMNSFLADRQQDDLYTTYMSYVAFQYCTLLINLHLSKPSIDKSVRAEVYSWKFLMQYNENQVVKLVRICSCLCGIIITGYLLYFYYKLRRTIKYAL